VKTCPNAKHAASIETCSAEYASWVLGFLDRSLPHAK
jgi:hypothetical protein